MNTRPLALAIACLLIAGFARSEDVLTLQDGTTHKGKVIHRGDTYTVVSGKKLFQFYYRDVKDLNGKAVATNDPVTLIKTDVGDIKVVLYEEEAPNTVANIITLAEKGYFKGMAFHRIVQGFMAQGGCPNSKEGAKGAPGTGGPGYKIGDEICPQLLHTGRGILSMANSGKDTNGSQFFLCLGPAPHLDGKHTVFGRVIEGDDVLDKLEAAASKTSETPTKMIRFDIQILSKRDTPYKVTKVGRMPRPRPRPRIMPAKKNVPTKPKK